MRRARWAGRVVVGAWVVGVSEVVACLVAPGSRSILNGHYIKSGARRKCISDLWVDGITRIWKTLSMEAQSISDVLRHPLTSRPPGRAPSVPRVIGGQRR